MTPEEIDALLTALTIFTLAILVGFAVISKVPATLHTPLMSGANSIHGIVMVGAMLIAASANDWISYLLAVVAMVFGAANVEVEAVSSMWPCQPSGRPSSCRTQSATRSSSSVEAGDARQTIAT